MKDGKKYQSQTCVYCGGPIEAVRGRHVIFCCTEHMKLYRKETLEMYEE